MRIANLNGRLVLLTADGSAVDVEQLSEGRFTADPQAVYERWSEFRAWAAGLELPAGIAAAAADLGAPSPAPRQVFGIGLNYRAHAAESGFAVPQELPPVFTKYTSSISGPVSRVRLPEGGHTDWEVELVVVIGRRAEKVAEDEAWEHVAGLCVGQDISERITHMQSSAPQ